MIDHGVVLESHQKQRFLQLLEQCSSSFKEQPRETNSQSPVVFKKDRDGHKFSSQIYGIERIVGLKSIQQFLAKKYNLLASENPLLKSLSQRVDLCVRKEGFEPENEAMQELSILRDFRYNRDAFFGSPLIVENFTYLHQYSPGDFNDACIQLAHLNSKRRVRIIDDLVDKVVHSSYSVDQMNMMHDMLFTMHQDYNHSQFLKDFINKLKQKSHYTTTSGLFLGSFGFFLSKLHSKTDELSHFQHYFVEQFRQSFYLSKQSIRRQHMTLDKYFGRQMSKKALSNFIKMLASKSKDVPAGWKMMANLLNDGSNETRENKSQLVQFIIDQLVASSAESNLNKNIQSLLKALPDGQQEMVCAEIAHYFKKGSLSMAMFRNLAHITGSSNRSTSASMYSHDKAYQRLIKDLIEKNHQSQEISNMLLSHLIIQAADHNSDNFKIK